MQDVQQTGCNPADPLQDCCHLFPTLFVSQGLDVNQFPIPQSFGVDTGGFGFVPDAFRNTTQPSYATGQRVTAATAGNPGPSLQVNLGGIDNATVNNMSGGWQTTFTLTDESLVS